MKRIESLEWRLAPASTVRHGANLLAAGLWRAVAALPYQVQIVAILLVASLLRFIRVGAYDLSLDEAISHFIIDRPLFEIITYCLSRAYEHPPTYYLLLRIWTMLAGNSEFALRWFSIAAGLLNIALLATLARRWFGPRVALLAALLMAIWPFTLQQSRDARMYPLLSLAALLTVFSFAAAVRRNRWRDWFLFLACFAFALSIHYLVGFAAVAFALLYLLWWRRRAELRVRFGVSVGVLVGLPLLVIAFAPGPRASLISFIEYGLTNPWSPARLVPIYAGWVLGLPAEMWPPWPAVLVSTLPWVLFAFGVAGPHAVAFIRRPSDREIRQTVLLLVLVPAMAGSLLFFFVAPRHHSAMTAMFILGVALGLERLTRRLPVGGILTVLLILLGSFMVALQRPGDSGRSFSEPLQYAEERSRSSEAMIFTYYFDRFQRDYYTRAGLTPYYLGNQNLPIVPEQADQQVAEIVRTSVSPWLMLRPDEHNPEVVEQALNAHAYPGQKQWFAGGRAIVHYFAPLFIFQLPGGPVWDAGISLAHWGRSDSVPAGDALRLEFLWQRSAEIDQPLLVGVDLRDEKGRVWAQRVGEPCNGLCPTNKWDGAPFLERQALYVPADTPPGLYQLHVYWMRPDGSLIQGQPDAHQTLRTDRVFLADVKVDPPQKPLPAVPLLSKAFTREVLPGLVLRSIELPKGTVRAGAHLEIPLQWQVAATQPQLDVQLQLRGPAEVTTPSQPLGTPVYPTHFWEPGRPVRTRPVFDLPGGLSTGRYEIRLLLAETGKQETLVSVPLGSLALDERPRRFQLPSIGVATDGEWHDGVRLARVVMPESARAGSELLLTLIWRASGVPDRNWKVFIHLVDAAGHVKAQGDAFPLNNGDGPAPTSSWREGEVILDEHRISLPPDLPAGGYTLLVGLYIEESSERLALSTGKDAFELPVKLDVFAP